MLDTIVDQRPGLASTSIPDFSDTSWSVEGNVNDGRGWGQLSVSLNKQAGAMTAHPCGDPEFVQGAACDERMLPTGERLVQRDVVDDHGVRSIQVVLLRPNRSGLSLEATNFLVKVRPTRRSRRQGPAPERDPARAGLHGGAARGTRRRDDGSPPLDGTAMRLGRRDAACGCRRARA